MKPILIVGSSRSDGDCTKLADTITKTIDLPIIDLNDYSISYYDYAHKNKDDDFIPLMRRIIAEHDTFIFVTPVYWYAMSGTMKVFFDRITDLITIEKDLGRKLRRKNMAVITTSNGDNLGEHFWLPFIKSADYLGMHYLGNLHTFNGTESEDLMPFIHGVMQ